MAEFNRKGGDPDPASMMPPDLIEKSPMLNALKEAFTGMLPGRFGSARVYISPVASAQSAIRADCGNKGCGTRAAIHIERREGGRWVFVEEAPVFDRKDKAKCAPCLEMFGQT